MVGRLRVLELYCGIGGCAAALGDRAEVVAAVDINRRALEVYAHNFRHPTINRTLESVPPGIWRTWEADLWWLSPPCQPYTQRGRQRDVDDPRAGSLLVVLDRLAECRPPWVALENVPGFHGSRTYGRLREVLAARGYEVREWLLCPTELGVPNRRRRFYLLASRLALSPGGGSAARRPFRIREILDNQPAPGLGVPPDVERQYAGALHLVDAEDERAECSCFTAGYGRSLVRSGSYLKTGTGLRRFSPQEILRLLGFPATFRLPPSVSVPQGWRLVGNSLSVAAVQAVLRPVFHSEELS